MRLGKLVLMHATIPRYALSGLDAVLADVIVEGDMVRVVERKSGRTLSEVKQEPSSSTLASVQSDGLTLVRRELAPGRVSTRHTFLFYLSLAT